MYLFVPSSPQLISPEKVLRVKVEISIVHYREVSCEFSKNGFEKAGRNIPFCEFSGN
jgi:hypothetical protein